MAADKEIMKRIETLRLDRPGRVYRAMLGDSEPGGMVGPGLIAALRELAATYREEAGLWSKSGARGWKSSETEAYLIAQAVDSVAAQLDNAGGGAALSVSDTGPRNRNRQCDDPQPHERHENGVGEVTGDTLYCLGVRPPADLSGLDQLIADSAAEGRGQLRKTAHEWNEDPSVDPFVVSWSDFGNSAHRLGMTFGKDDPITLAEFERARDGGAVTVGHRRPYERDGRTHNIDADAVPLLDTRPTGADEVTAYLSGEVDTLPGLREALVPGSVRTPDADADLISPENRAKIDSLQDFSATMTIHGSAVDGVLPVTWENDVTSPDGHRLPGNIPATVPPVPLLGQPGDAGAGYDPLYIPPGGVPFTFAELMTPAPYAALPPHLSNSQMNTVGECPAKYRLQRLARNTDPRATPEMNPQIPQWANIGGTAFHLAVESIERRVVTGLADGSAADLTTWNVEQCWEHAFGQAIAEIESTSPVPRALWRASKRGAEGETWWNANGPEMLKRYLAARPAEPTMDIPVLGAGGIEQIIGIEADLTVQVPTGTGYGVLPFNAILDRVTAGAIPGDPARGALIVRDYKSGDRMPDSNAQLAEQAWTLRLTLGQLGGPPSEARIYGTYFNARKGTWTTPVDLFAEYTWDWFVYRLVSAHAQKLALTTGPTPARVTSYCGGCSVKWACPVGGPKR